MKKKLNLPGEHNPEKEILPGNPVYSSEEDIYSQEERVELDEEILLDNPIKKRPIPPMDNDLDIPGAELDDSDELLGEEDEENNYYSLGGDNHNNLEEDNGQ